jgi:hypothetical protein
MCLNIDVNHHPKYGSRGQAFVAKQPILVYKRLSSADDKGGHAPYMGTRWLFGVEKRVPYFTYDGFTSSPRRYVEAGLHAFWHKDARRLRNFRNQAFPAVIPVGAKFFIGEGNEIVSTALTVYRTEEDMLRAFNAKKVGTPIPRDTLTRDAI